MSEPLRANFLPEHIIFRKECQCKIKILNFCIGCFDKINLSKRDNLSKCDIFFSNLSCYAKTGLKKTIFSKFWTLKKINTCFKRPMKELKTAF